MNIPKFPLPSRPEKEIAFDSPRVKTAIKYATLNPDEDELTTTEYLNSLQLGEVDDALDWTVQDRRTALWWIFVNSRPEPMMTFSYQCQHCGQSHHADIDMADLAETAELLSVPPYTTTQVPVNGKPTDWKLHPLTGRGAEMLERMRHALPDAESPTYTAERNKMRIAEFALCTSLADDPADYKDAANRRFDILNEMDLEREFKPLVARIQLMQHTLRHGLAMTIENGEAHLLLPPQHCKNDKEGAGLSTVLHVPFLSRDFIASIKPQWLANDY